MATRQGRPEHTPEAEPVLIAWTEHQLILVLDDGEELRFDRTEFEASKS
jgi:hypothetical protein